MFTWFRQGVGEVAFRVDNAGDGEAVDRFWVFDRVAAKQATFCLDTDFCTAFKDVADGLMLDVFGGHSGDGECGDRAAAHGVDIGERVGGGDFAVEHGIIDDGGKEIGGLDEGALVVDFKYASVVRSSGADEEAFVMELRQLMQDLREGLGVELGGSSGAGGKGC